MATATFRFYAELNDFLPPARRLTAWTHFFQGRVSVKDVIESLGVPHTEVDLVLVNGRSVDFSYLVQDGDAVSVYPMFETLDIAPLVRLRPRPLRRPKFVLDTHLGRLAAYLRLLGFDTLYWNEADDADLARRAANEERILLTKDRGLLKRRLVTHGYCVRQVQPRQQVLEVLHRFELFGALEPFSRCLRCNGRLMAVDKQAVADCLPPAAREYYAAFCRCADCGRVYWPGSHYKRLRQVVDEIVSQAAGGRGDGEPSAGRQLPE